MSTNFYSNPEKVKKFITNQKLAIRDLEERNMKLQQRIIDLLEEKTTEQIEAAFNKAAEKYGW